MWETLEKMENIVVLCSTSIRESQKLKHFWGSSLWPRMGSDDKWWLGCRFMSAVNWWTESWTLWSNHWGQMLISALISLIISLVLYILTQSLELYRFPYTVTNTFVFVSSLTGKAPQKRTPWQPAEVRAVERQMNQFIRSCTVPSKRDCEKCLRAEPEALRKRDWKNLKFYIYNRITALKRKMSK